jgi:hypothetical protein
MYIVDEKLNIPSEFYFKFVRRGSLGNVGKAVGRSRT